MASLILGTIGNAAFGPIGGLLGALGGAKLDGAIGAQIGGFKSNQSRLSSLKIQSSQDGADIPIIYGKMRVSGQIIWASDFKETQIKRQIGGKGGQKVKENYYSISFAIGLCEGEISGLGQVWINGEKSDLSRFEHRVYKGSQNQEPDPLIEAILGAQNTPHYNGLAYIVFEDLPLAEFGDRIPQMAFEVFAHPVSDVKPLEELIDSFCLIPGAGEFCHATTPIVQQIKPGKERRLNQHQSVRYTDLLVSLDNLQRDLPNIRNISLVAAWFGNDLRAEYCQIMPRTDSQEKVTKPRNWHVAGLDRANAQMISLIDGKPAYGGSPDDISLIEAIKEITKRGIKVTFNPFIMMDIAANNNLPNPYGGTSQFAYPWRGRITCTPAIGQNQSAQGTNIARSQIESFFGTIKASDFTISGSQIGYNGPNQWSYSRFIMHMAAICKAAGGVDTFLLGSEMVGLSRIRDTGGNWIFVDNLVQLAAEVKLILGPNTKISYGADWTEYGAYYDAELNNTYFPLDGLWASNDIDFIGIDYYAPLSDRGPNDASLNVTEFAQNIESGEGYNYYYANENARAARIKTPIEDNIYNEPWIYRPKDIRGFWSNQHYERNNGIRNSSATLWTAKSKPIRFLEFGIAAIDKGANRPSVFPDAKSFENGVPPFSTGTRNDSEHRNGLNAFISYWLENNEISPLYNSAMLDVEKTFIWAWDARPFPAFINRTDVWADAVNYAKGHWIMGRMGQIPLASIVSDINKRAGLSTETGEITGSIDGYIIERNQSAREAIEPLLTCFGIELNNHNYGLKYTKTPEPDDFLIVSNSQLLPNDEFSLFETNFDIDAQIGALEFQSFALDNDFQVQSALVHNAKSSSQSAQYSAPIVTDSVGRNAIASLLLRQATNNFEAQIEVVGELALKLELNDRVKIGDGPVLRIDKISGFENAQLSLSYAPEGALNLTNVGIGDKYQEPIFQSAPIGFVLDLPAPFGDAINPRPIGFCASENWTSEVDIKIDGNEIASCEKCATIGEVIEEFPASANSRLINRPLKIRLDFGNLSRGPSSAAIIKNNQIIDIINWQIAKQTGLDSFELHQIVRGLNGSYDAPNIESGSVLVLFNEAGIPIDLKREFWNIDLSYHFSRSDLAIDLDNSFTSSFTNQANKLWAPCHIRCKRQDNGIAISFIPRSAGAHLGLDSIDEFNNSFKISILDMSGQLKCEIQTLETEILYDLASELADFGTPLSQINIRVVSISPNGELGKSAAGIFPL